MGINIISYFQGKLDNRFKLRSGQPMKTLVYVDSKLAVAMAAKLVGSELQEENNIEVGGAFNWLVQAYVNKGDGTSITREISELLPEEVMYELYAAISDEFKFPKISDCINKMADVSTNRLLPGRSISVEGVLSFPDLGELANYNPFDPPDITLKTFKFYGEPCFTGELRAEGFRLPIYFDETAKAHIVYCNDQPVEVTGIVRWSPPYSPKGANSLSLVIRAAALWLR